MNGMPFPGTWYAIMLCVAVGGAYGQASTEVDIEKSSAKEKIIKKREVIPMQVHRYSPEKRLRLTEDEGAVQHEGELDVVNRYLASLVQGNREELYKILDEKETARLKGRMKEGYEKVVKYYNRRFSGEYVFVTHRLSILGRSAFVVTDSDENGDVRSGLPVFVRNTENGWKITGLNNAEVYTALLEGYPYTEDEVIRTKSTPGVITTRRLW